MKVRASAVHAQHGPLLQLQQCRDSRGQNHQHASYLSSSNNSHPHIAFTLQCSLPLSPSPPPSHPLSPYLAGKRTPENLTLGCCKISRR